MLATRFIAPHLERFAAQHPEITLELSCTNRSVSLARREADVALRLSRPREVDVITKRLASVHLALYAAPAYLQRRGTPADAERTLHGHSLILFADLPMFAVENAWLEARAQGAHVAVRSDSVSSIYAAAVAGAGIALLPRAVADSDPKLVRIATASEPEPRTIWQAVHADLQRSARIRAVLAFLAEVLEREGNGF
jgi:DNA-binding transcriptional LysR family regulator